MRAERDDPPAAGPRALREIPRGLALALCAGLAALLAGYAIAGALGISASALTRDPAAIARHPFYYGFFSNLGVLIWSATAGGLVIAGLALRRPPADARRSAFLLWFGAVTALLAVDDVLMLHEEVYRRLLPGPSEVPVALYGALLVGGLLHFRELVRRSACAALAVSLAFFAVSLLIDTAVSRPSALAMYVEDGAKLLGIIAWAGYFGRESVRAFVRGG